MACGARVARVTASTWRRRRISCGALGRRASRGATARRGRTWRRRSVERAPLRRGPARRANSIQRHGGRRMRRVSRPSSTRRETCWRRYSCTGGWRTCSARVGTCRRSRRSSSARSSGCGWTARVCLRLASTCTWTSGCDSRLSGCARAAVWAHAGGGGGSTSSVGQRGRRAARVISSRCRARRPGGARLTSAPMRWASIVGRCRTTGWRSRCRPRTLS